MGSSMEIYMGNKLLYSQAQQCQIKKRLNQVCVI